MSGGLGLIHTKSPPEESYTDGFWSHARSLSAFLSSPSQTAPGTDILLCLQGRIPANQSLGNPSHGLASLRNPSNLICNLSAEKEISLFSLHQDHWSRKTRGSLAPYEGGFAEKMGFFSRSNCMILDRELQSLSFNFLLCRTEVNNIPQGCLKG